MDNEKLKLQIGCQIATFRKMNNMTQADLAERLNYSDKAVSKWERGESVPDVFTLVQLSEQLGVSVNDLLCPQGEVIPELPAGKPQHRKRRVNKRVIQMLVSILVWFVALSVYVILSSMDIPKSWIGFLYAVPANAIVLLSLRSAWRLYGWNIVLISAIVWGCLGSFYVTMLVFAGYNIWRLFLLGVLGQAAVILWFRLFHPQKEEANG